MSTDDATSILIAIDRLGGRLDNLEKAVSGLHVAPVECSRITFNVKQVVAIILALGLLNLGSGAATYLGLSNIAQSKVEERKTMPAGRPTDYKPVKAQ